MINTTANMDCVWRRRKSLKLCCAVVHQVYVFYGNLPIILYSNTTNNITVCNTPSLTFLYLNQISQIRFWWSHQPSLHWHKFSRLFLVLVSCIEMLWLLFVIKYNMLRYWTFIIQIHVLHFLLIVHLAKENNKANKKTFNQVVIMCWKINVTYNTHIQQKKLVVLKLYEY